ncbi:MAG: phage terminase large subunit [Rikenellaceae bacterium]|nr:phage terminase large subunit [Rikenellaceae bacterium]
MALTTQIPLTHKQKIALSLLDDDIHDKLLFLGGSGSGKSFVIVYKMIRDALRYGAPILIARDRLVDLTTGVIDQLVPTILQLIAEANGQSDWRKWKIDGLKFASWTDRRTKLEFCNGGYIRFGGLSKRDMSESGQDKILSPSWLHIFVDEVSEEEWDTIELLITRLRYKVEGVTNKLAMAENPPSMVHWSYARFYEHKRIDNSMLSLTEQAKHVYLEMQPRDNLENLGEEYIQNLSQLTGANRERFYEGRFQDSASGEILKKVIWTSNLPRKEEWDKLIIYTDPTPLVTREHSQYADYKTSILAGLYDGMTFVLDCRMIRGSTLDMLQGIRQLWQMSPNQSITEVCMEKKGVPSDFDQVMKQFAAMTGWCVPIVWDTRQFGEKKAAIETFLQPLFENELVVFNEAFRGTERGKQAEYQILKFSRKNNKFIHDDFPDALMKADTKMKGKSKRVRTTPVQLIGLVRPAYVSHTRRKT